jgi:DNA-binding SARP family transcriptional activator
VIAMTRSRVEISVLGNPQVVFNSKDITGKLSTKSLGILCYIAASESINREKLAFMFWEESSEESAKYNLRYNIWSMNKLFKNENLENPLILSEGSRICFNGEYEVVSDIEVVDDLYSKKEGKTTICRLNRMREIYRGEFLEGFYLKGCFKFNDWIFFERENYQKKYIGSLNKLLDIFKTEKNYIEGIIVLEELIRLNSLDEDLYVDLMKLYMDMGDRTSAMKQYDRCTHILREELNISPKESTKNLLKIIKETKYGNPAEYKDRGTADIVLLRKDELKKIADGVKTLEGLVITTGCIPMEGLDYNYLALLVDEIIISCKSDILEKIDMWVWKDLGRISLNALKYSRGEISALSTETERNRIYQSLLEMLMVASRELKVNIIAENLQYMDRASFGFIKYLLFRKGELDFNLYFTCDEDDCKIIELKRFFDI